MQYNVSVAAYRLARQSYTRRPVPSDADKSRDMQALIARRDSISHFLSGSVPRRAGTSINLNDSFSF